MKKNQSIAINTLVIIIIALIVLVFLILFFSGVFSKSSHPVYNVTNAAGSQVNNIDKNINGLS